MRYTLVVCLCYCYVSIVGQKNNSEKCPATRSGCIFDDDVQGSDCTIGGNAVCKAVGADYCSAVFGTPPQRVCCNVTGAYKVHSHPDVRGCPPSNQGCIFDDRIHGADCTLGGNVDCFATGGNYCSAWFGYPPRRVCCMIANDDTVSSEVLKTDDAHACPDTMSGCIYDDYVNGADCSNLGNQDCIKAGSDYCSGWVKSERDGRRRTCCDIDGDIPYGPAISNGSTACPLSNRGCIYDDISVDSVKCTVGGNAKCIATGHDYCSAFHQDLYETEPERVCCDITRDDNTLAAIAKYERTCPVKTSGCIYDDIVGTTDCTLGGNPTCRAVGDDYCSAVFGHPPRRVCCKIDGLSKFQESHPDIRGCPPSNFGCIYDDKVNGADCTIDGNKACLEAGSGYCSAWFGHPPRRVCCDVARDTRTNVYKGTYEETCPESTIGCIFDDYIHGADCTIGGNADCLSNGSDYCGAWVGNPPRRQCCSIAGPGPAPSHGDASRACPARNSGCIYDDDVEGSDCTENGNEACKAAGADYCSAFVGMPPKRVCCKITGLDNPELEKYLIMTVIFAFLIIVIIVLTFGIWYRINKQKEVMRMWRVPAYALHKYEPTKSGTTVASSMNSMSSTGSKTSELTLTKNEKMNITYDIYYYKGSLVGVQKHRSGVAIRKQEMVEMIHMRQMSDDNVNAFLGLCVDGLQLMSIWKLCPKGCLLDLFEKDNLKLDWVFKYSIVRDMVEGMDYIGKSWLKKHGHLTSKCCLMDSRWQLKISDYGLQSIRKADPNASDAETLWHAPEKLRQPDKEFGIEADIYSMAIVMWEILGRTVAWSTLDAAPEEITYRVRKGEVPAFRPIVSLSRDSDTNPAMVQLMKDCWEEKAENRPNLRTIRHSLKAMMRGRSTNLMDHVMHMMEEYAGTLEAEVNERTHELHEEKKKADLMLYRMLPKSVVDKMKSGQTVDPESFEQVSIMSSDIAGFTTLSAPARPNVLVAWLNDIYNVCDSIIDQYNVYKVESSTDGYLCASGLPLRNGDEHATQIAELALSLRRSVSDLKIPHLPREKMKIRIGIHTGPVVAGVVGLQTPRYCLFGESIIVAARMENNAKPNMIHITERTNQYLTTHYDTKLRGEIMLKDVGVITSYWLLNKVGQAERQIDKFTDDILRTE